MNTDASDSSGALLVARLLKERPIRSARLDDHHTSRDADLREQVQHSVFLREVIHAVPGREIGHAAKLDGVG